MPTPILVPKVARNTNLYKVAHWNKKINELVHQEEILLEFEVNKATVPLLSRTTGYLIKKCRVAGEYIKYKETIAILAHPAEFKKG